MDGFDDYLLLLPSGAGGLLLPSGAGGHDRHAERLRAIAELHGYDGWLLGCRDKGWRHGRRRQIMVTPLAVLRPPAGTIGAALAAAGGLHGCVYVLAAAGEAP